MAMKILDYTRKREHLKDPMARKKGKAFMEAFDKAFGLTKSISPYFSTEHGVIYRKVIKDEQQN